MPDSSSEQDLALGIVETLYATVQSRRSARADQSYSAHLLAAGPLEISRKVAEEAIEVVLAGAQQQDSHAAIVAESVDLLYHLVVLWVSLGADLQAIASEVSRRQGQSGLAEKRSRVSAPTAPSDDTSGKNTSGKNTSDTNIL